MNNGKNGGFVHITLIIFIIDITYKMFEVISFFKILFYHARHYNCLHHLTWLDLFSRSCYWVSHMFILNRQKIQKKRQLKNNSSLILLLVSPHIHVFMVVINSSQQKVILWVIRFEYYQYSMEDLKSFLKLLLHDFNGLKC